MDFKRKKRSALEWLYGTAAGRVLLKVLAGRRLSVLCGRMMDSRFSRRLIPVFVRKNGIDLSDYAEKDYTSFNDFFTRSVKPEKRPVDRAPSSLIAPCDGLLSVCRIGSGSAFEIKNSLYSVETLLNGDAVSKRFEGGVCLIFRLCVNNYHRYHYFDSGVKGENVFVPGRLHTVQPVALLARPVFAENCREYTVMRTEHFGTAAQIEVGAMLVGKIRNHDGAGRFERGQEKGMFLYGGSTVVLLLEPGRAELPERLFANTEMGIETPVRFGEKIGSTVGRDF